MDNAECLKHCPSSYRSDCMTESCILLGDGGEDDLQQHFGLAVFSV